MLTNLFTSPPEMSIRLEQQGLDFEQWLMRSWSPLGSEELLRYEGEYVFLLSINVVNPKSDTTAVISRPRNLKVA